MSDHPNSNLNPSDAGPRVPPPQDPPVWKYESLRPEEITLSAEPDIAEILLKISDSSGSRGACLNEIDTLAQTHWRWAWPVVAASIPASTSQDTLLRLHCIEALYPRAAGQVARSLYDHPDASTRHVAKAFGHWLVHRRYRFNGTDPDERTALGFPQTQDPDELLSSPLDPPSPAFCSILADSRIKYFQHVQGQEDIWDHFDYICGELRCEALHTLLGQVIFERLLCRPDFCYPSLAPQVDTSLDSFLAMARAATRIRPDLAIALLDSWCDFPDLPRDHLLLPICNLQYDLSHIAVNLLVELVHLDMARAASTGKPLRRMALSILSSISLAQNNSQVKARLRRSRSIFERLVTYPDPYVRSTALLGLAEMLSPEWQTRAFEFLDDTEGIVRSEALALLEFGMVSVDRTTLERLLQDPEPYVRMRAARMLNRLKPDPEWLFGLLKEEARDGDPIMQQAVLGVLPYCQAPGRYGYARQLMKSSGEWTACKALHAATQCASGPDDLWHSIQAGLASQDSAVRVKAIRLLVSERGETAEGTLRTFLSDPDFSVRREAFVNLVAISSDQKQQLAEDMATDADHEIACLALNLLKEQFTSDDSLFEVLLNIMANSKKAYGIHLVNELETLMGSDPSRIRRVADIGWRSRIRLARLLAARIYGEQGDVESMQDDRDLRASRLWTLLGDEEIDVQIAAAKGLVSILSGPRHPRLALHLLQKEHSALRAMGIDLLKKTIPMYPDRRSLLHALLPLARDPDEDIRRESLNALAQFDDARVRSELVSSLDDLNENVRKRARTILHQGSTPAVRGLPQKPIPWWKPICDQVDRINRWGVDIGSKLLRKPVAVLNYRCGLGRTRYAPGKRETWVTIEVSNTPVTQGHPRGEQVMQGLVLHEIGHHLYDIHVRGHGMALGKARAEGLETIFSFLLDERLERLLRSRRARWGEYFDALAAYAFAEETSEVNIDQYARLFGISEPQAISNVQEKELPGRLIQRPADGTFQVQMKTSDTLAVPNLVPPVMAWALCLRAGVDPRIAHDSRVLRAAKVVPGNLKRLAHSQLLPVARQIGQLLGLDPEHKAHMQRFRQKIDQLPDALRTWKAALSRGTETGIHSEPDRPLTEPIRDIELSCLDMDGEKRDGYGGWHSTTRILLPGRGFHLGHELDFDRLAYESEVNPKTSVSDRLDPVVRPHILQLRQALSRLALREHTEHASRSGRRLDLGRMQALAIGASTQILLHHCELADADAYIGLLIDRSGSMAGEEIRLAKTFASLLAEAGKGVPGLLGHINAFDDNTFLRLGTFARHAIQSLEVGGGNNDAGALLRAAELAMTSRKRNRMLIMISDGYPTDCSFESLENLVKQLSRRGFVCAQIAVSRLPQEAFPNYLDVSEMESHEAIGRFTRLIMDLTRHWR